MSLGIPELLIILVIVVLIFGAGRLAGLGRGLGQAIRGFKEELPGEQAEALPHVRAGTRSRAPCVTSSRLLRSQGSRRPDPF